MFRSTILAVDPYVAIEGDLLNKIVNLYSVFCSEEFQSKRKEKKSVNWLNEIQRNDTE
jgi:hypothetical protein